uniref:Ig-like domain-containing protein n=1 Tax=Nothoprocta perdicaria TaxID=30464 RepID=A0A8C7A2L9_NOTPE
MLLNLHCLFFLRSFFLILNKKPSPVDMLKGTEVSLECEISGTPPFDITWYKDRRQIRSSKKYKVTAKNYHTSVHILNVEAADVGEYQCKAQNDVGSDTCFCTVKLKAICLHLSFSLVCLEPPSFEKTPEPLDVLPGTSITFTGVIRGTPPFKVNWFRGANELLPGDKCNIYLEDSVVELELFDVSPLQSGEYTCQVTNDAGRASCTTHLIVKGL